jgi:hypothetical protein
MPFQLAPLLFRCFRQLKDHRQHARAQDATACFVGAQSHGAKGRFARIRDANVLPVLGWKIIKRQQDLPIFAQTLGRLGILCFLAQQEMVQRLVRRRSPLGHGDLIELSLGFSLQPLRQVGNRPENGLYE